MAVHHDESLARFRAIGDRWGMAVALSERASLRMLAGDLEGAEAALDGTEALLAELGSRVDGGMILLRRAELRLRLGDLSGARELLDDAFERTRDRDERMLVRVGLASVSWRLGDRDRARALRDEAVEAVERLDAKRPDYAHMCAIALGGAAAMFADDGELGRARELAVDAYAAAVRSRDLPVLGRFGGAAAIARRALRRSGPRGRDPRGRDAPERQRRPVEPRNARAARRAPRDARGGAARRGDRGRPGARPRGGRRPARPGQHLDALAVGAQRERDERRQQRGHPGERPPQVRAHRVAEQQRRARRRRGA